MYLIQIDSKTGLIKEDPNNDSWCGIKCFRELVERDGLKALTVVALSLDYLSIFSHYAEKDRPIRVIDEIYGNRDAYNHNEELVQKCFQKYKDLQFNPDLEQEKIYNNRRHQLLEKVNEAVASDDEAAIDRYTAQLNKHNEAAEKFKKTFNKEKALEDSVSNSGYKLSRIENDLKSRKNSTFKDTANATNPNRLGLENQF